MPERNLVYKGNKRYARSKSVIFDDGKAVNGANACLRCDDMVPTEGIEVCTILLNLKEMSRRMGVQTNNIDKCLTDIMFHVGVLDRTREHMAGQCVYL